MFAVFIDQDSPRTRYVLQEILSRRWNTALAIFTNWNEFKASNEFFKIEYTTEKRDDSHSFFIQRENIIVEEGVNEYFNPTTNAYHISENTKKHLSLRIKNIDLSHSEKSRMLSVLDEPYPCLFPNDGDLGFDLFSMVFYFLSRYEEFQRFEEDKWGRFHYKNSFVSELHYNPSPVLDIAIIHFLGLMGALKKIQLPFDVQPTVDIDIAYRFKGRSLGRTLLSTFRFPLHLPHRIWSYLSRKDPFDPNNTVSEYLKGQENQSRVFWLCSSKTNGANKQVQRKYPPFQSIIRSIDKQTNIGLHPSLSTSPISDWKEEKEWLEKTTASNITHSRQHFLHLLFPDTYHILQKIGITDDWSMGFAENVGFRAGTAYPFHWFDLSKNKETNLCIHPFCLMDVTAKNYMKLNQDQAIDVGQTLKELVFIFGGRFAFIVHNESLSEAEGWGGWKRVFNSWKNPKIAVTSSLKD